MLIFKKGFSVDVWALEWAWNLNQANFRCPRTSRTCMPSPNFL